MSGSGKSVALKVLEDRGYYCVDNLPVNLLPGLIDFLADESYGRVAVSVDVRSGPTLKELPAWGAMTVHAPTTGPAPSCPRDSPQCQDGV